MKKNNSIVDAKRDAFADEKKHLPIIRRYCDEPMAKRKRLLPCDKNCKQCFACIEVLRGGDRRHFSPVRPR